MRTVSTVALGLMVAVTVAGCSPAAPEDVTGPASTGSPTTRPSAATSTSSAPSASTAADTQTSTDSSTDRTAGADAAASATVAVRSAANTVLDDFGTWLRAQPGIDTSGYIQSVDDPDRSATALLWFGTSPLQALAIDEATRRGITATITDWPYSATELEAAARALYDQTDGYLDLGFVVNDISAIPADFAGVDLCGQYADGTEPDDDAVRRLTTSITAIPVRLDSDCTGTT